MLSKSQRLKKNIEYFIRRGKKYYGKYIFFSVLPSNNGNKIGFVITKKVGNAVKRNLLRRRERSIIQEFIPNFKFAVNLVILSNTSSGKWEYIPSYEELKQDIGNLLKTSNLIE